MTDVLLLTNALAPERLGGLERYVAGLAEALAADGARVAVAGKRADRARPSREERAGVAVERFRVPRKGNPLFAALYPVFVAVGAVRAARRHPGALLHAHFAVPALPFALGPRRRPYVYTFHAPVHRELASERQGSYRLPAERLAVALLRAAERRVVRRASRVVVLSEYMRARLAELCPATAARAVLVPGGVDLRWFTPGPGAPDGRADWIGTGPLLVTARRLTPRTGVLELIRAMPAVLRAHPGARLAVLGDGALAGAAAREVARLRLGASVRLLGRVPEAELRDWYRRADLAVTPTQELEGFGLATAEAMACGATPLVTPVGANPELVARLPAGCLADGASPDELGRAIGARLARPGVPPQALRAEARRWSWDAVREAHVRLYREVARS